MPPRRPPRPQIAIRSLCGLAVGALGVLAALVVLWIEVRSPAVFAASSPPASPAVAAPDVARPASRPPQLPDPEPEMLPPSQDPWS